MPNVRITWTDRNADEGGHRIYRDTAPLDPGALPAPLAELGPDITSYDDTTAADSTIYYYLVTAFKGDFEAVSGEVSIDTGAPAGTDWSTVSVGDEVEGGIYAGQITYSDGRQFHIVAAKAAGEAADLAWGNASTTTGVTDDDDGRANQDLTLASFDNGDSYAFYHCRDYTAGGFVDWYLPARNEMALVKANLGETGHPEFTDAESPSPYRWTSTEFSDLYAYHSRLSGSQGAYNTKSVGQRARPVRRVKIEPDYSTAQIGDEIGGGIYAGSITYGDGRQFHIVAAKESDGLSAANKWGYYNTVTGFADPDDGLANHNAMLAKLDSGDDYGSHPPEAFIHCRDFTGGGNTDWYLPAKNELNVVYANLYAAGHAEFPTAAQYDHRWTSTEVDGSFAWVQNVETGEQRDNYGYKDTPNYHALPVRRVPV